MYKNLNGSSSDEAKWAENVAGWFCVEPVDCVSFANYNKGLKNNNTFQ